VLASVLLVARRPLRHADDGSSRSPLRHGATVIPHERVLPQAPQHPDDRLRSGTPALVLPGEVSLPCGTASVPKTRVHRLLQPLLTLLAQPGQPVTGATSKATGSPTRDHARSTRSCRPARPRWLAAHGAGYRSSYIGSGPVPLSHPGHGGLRLRRLGRQRPALHGWAGTGVHVDPLIAPTPPTGSPSTPPRRGRARRDTAWFLTVALVNPHDVMWFPWTSPDTAKATPTEVAAIRQVLESAA